MVPLSFATLPASKVLSPEQKAALKDGFRQAAKDADHPLIPKMVELQLGWLDNDEVAFMEYVKCLAPPGLRYLDRANTLSLSQIHRVICVRSFQYKPQP